VSTSEVDKWRTVSFWTENLTEVLIWSFPKIEVLSVMQIETQGLKNKVVKTQGLKIYLTLNLMLNLKLNYMKICKTKRYMYHFSPCSIHVNHSWG
jgi:hypothetical protein